MSKILTITGLSVVAVVLMIGAPAQAQIFDISFDPGAEPLTFGYLCLGACDGTGSEDPDTNPISVNPLNGVWEHVNADGGGTLWGVGTSHGLPNPFSSLFSSGTTTISGFARLRANIAGMDLRGRSQSIGLPGIGFNVGVSDTAIGWSKTENAAVNVLGPIVNNVGEFHDVGWEFDIVAKTATAWFDGAQIGEPFDVSGETGSYLDDFHMFGTGWSYAVDTTWDRVVVCDVAGCIPEPSSLALLGLGAIMMLRRRRV